MTLLTRPYAKRLLMVVALYSLAGCVTTESGGLPKPDSDENRVKAHLDLARGYLEQRDVTSARRPLEAALDIDPTNAEANVLLAMVYQTQGENELAESSFKRAIRYAPEDSMARNNYGTFLYSQGRLEDARKQLELAIRDPSYVARPQAYENLGLTELKLGLTDAAEQSFQHALMLNSKQARSMLELADLYFEKGVYPTSKQYFDGFSRESRHNARSLWLGIRLGRVFDDKNAVASYALALKNLYPGSDEFRMYEASRE